MINNIIVLEWLATAIGALLFLAVYGRPSRYQDRVMSWHIVSVTVVAGLESLGLLLVGVLGTGPIAVIYGLSAGVVYWRLWLLMRTRRP